MARKADYTTLDGVTLAAMKAAALSRLTSQQPVRYTVGGQSFEVWSVTDATQMLQDVQFAIDMQGGAQTRVASMAFCGPYQGGDGLPIPSQY